MILSYLEVKNFRGIRQACLKFPRDSRIVCIIGPGDSCKSTILEAITWVLYPSWELRPNDNDFYNGDTDSPITITASFSELPSKLLTETKFGLYLRDLDYVIHHSSTEDADTNDEPKDEKRIVLTTRLTIGSDLEPRWDVITSRMDPQTISATDRRLMAFGFVGMDPEKDFTWGKGSVLQKRTEANEREVLQTGYVDAMRNAINNISLNSLDNAVAPDLTKVGKLYGVEFNGDLTNKLLMRSGSFSSNAGLFDGEVPLTQRGLGSRRLMSIGMNVSAYTDGTLVLVDEIETGLEPYRIQRLINAFRDEFKNKGQLIATTHSTSAVCECTQSEIAICRCNDGTVELIQLNEGSDLLARLDWIKDLGKKKQKDNNDLADIVQGLLRSYPGAFLSKKIIVCEGKTEVGLMRAFDRFLISKGQGSLAYHGVGVVPGGGGYNYLKLAVLLRKCGYETCILMDSDLQEMDDIKTNLVKDGISVFSWESGNAIEEQVFHDVPLELVQQLINYVVEENAGNVHSIADQLKSQFKHPPYPYEVQDDTLQVSSNITPEQLICIGQVAKSKNSGWFKRTDHGEYMGEVIFGQWDRIPSDSVLRTTLKDLRKWVIGDD